LNRSPNAPHNGCAATPTVNGGDGSAVLIVELRYFPQIADAIIAAGFLFERHALPN
jgi:hypothetical protein